ncbi:hypothetical protein D3C76_1695450 [compost metagenome]
MRRINIGIQHPAFLIQLAFNVERIAPQRQIDTRDRPLPGRIATQGTARRYLVLFHIAVELQHRHL